MTASTDLTREAMPAWSSEPSVVRADVAGAAHAVDAVSLVGIGRSPGHPIPSRRGRGRHAGGVDDLGASTRRPIGLGDVVLPPPTGWLRRVIKRPLLRHYNRLLVLVLVVNAMAFWRGFSVRHWWTDDETALAATSAAALANFALAILIRQQYVINVLFWIATRAPASWPLRIRWTLAKVYHFGGFHVGGAVAGSFWFVAYSATVLWSWLHGSDAVSPITVAVSSILTVLLLGMLLTALPPVRARYHDAFEFMHRYGGWSTLLLFWVLAWVGVLDTLMGSKTTLAEVSVGTVLATPRIWILTLLTASVALPWLRLRKVPVEIEQPSSHVAVARLWKPKRPFPGSSTAISTNPFSDWHAFANVPSPDKHTFRLIISRAGDWTGGVIDQPPEAVWIRGITTAGVANVERLFRKVVYVATGSGIGPVIPHLLAGDVPSHLVWATRSPVETYGTELVSEILRARPDARIWDTKLHGKPDMVRLTYLAYVESGAEAVICIANKPLTWQVVYGMERLGIPAFGAIWDS